MKRRTFLKNTAAAAMLGCFPAILTAQERDRRGRIERRTLGKTGAKLSILGFGSFVLKDGTPEQARTWTRLAFEGGVNYFDVAPAYGRAEELIGPALEPFRKDVFLSGKTAKRKHAEAQKDLENSLRVLRTDHLDLYQLHHVTTLEEVDTIFGPEGAMQTLAAAKKSGQARFLGFSAHSVEAAMALMDRYDFDSIMFPVNYATWHAGNFGPQVLARAREKRMGIIALKAMAKRPWQQGADRSKHPVCWYEPLITPEEALMGLRFTLSHPVTAAIHPADEQCFKLALELAPKFTPLKEFEVEEIKQRALAETPLFRYPRQQRAAQPPEYYHDHALMA